MEAITKEKRRRRVSEEEKEDFILKIVEKVMQISLLVHSLYSAICFVISYANI